MSTEKSEVGASAASCCWAAFLDACDPDKTKALFMGEFTTAAPEYCDTTGIIVCWSTIKEIQAAILEQAKLNAGYRCQGCGSSQHILTLRDRGLHSCCAMRCLVPPNPEGSVAARERGVE